MRNGGILRRALLLRFQIGFLARVQPRSWRWHLALFSLFLSAFSAGVIVLELLPSRTLFKTTFVATLETQAVTVRIGQNGAVIPGIAGSRISILGADTSSDANQHQQIDLMQFQEPQPDGMNGPIQFSTRSDNAYLEIDKLVIPSGQLLELVAAGTGKHFSLIVSGGGSNPAEAGATIVWNGSVAMEPAGEGQMPIVGLRQWRGKLPTIEIDTAEFSSPIYSPSWVSSFTSTRIKPLRNDLIPASTLLRGEVQFFFGRDPGERIALGAGEFLEFSDLEGLLTNLNLTESGLGMVLVGEADAVSTGYLANLRNVTPSALAGIRAKPSLMLMLSAFFTLSLALVSSISLARNDKG
jgi:hypothetical protein